MANHYRLERTTIVDHAGTDNRELLVTKRLSILECEVRYARERPHGGFTQDVLVFAWDAAIVREDTDALEFWLEPVLSCHSGGKCRTARCWRQSMENDGVK